MTEQQVDAPALPPLMLPPWMDGTWMVHAGDWHFTKVRGLPAVSGSLIPGSSRRWAIGFVRPSVVISSVWVAPHPEPQQFGFLVPTGNAPLWFTLFTHGPLVCAEWYVLSADSENIGVYTAEVM